LTDGAAIGHKHGGDGAAPRENGYARDVNLVGFGDALN